MNFNVSSHSEYIAVKIGDFNIPVDHIVQINFKGGFGVYGDPGTLTMTSMAFKAINSGNFWNPINQPIAIIVADKKGGKIEYKGLITEFSKEQTDKNTLVLMQFDRIPWIKLKTLNHWECFENKNILQILETVLEKANISLNVFPNAGKSHKEVRGTHWDYFCIPNHLNTIDYLLEELKKDNFLFFSNPEMLSQGDNAELVVVNWTDLQRLDEVGKNFPSFVDTEVFVKYDETGDYKKTFFQETRQSDSIGPYDVGGFKTAGNPNLFQQTTHIAHWFSGLKRSLVWKQNTSDWRENDIGLDKEGVVEYSGETFINMDLRPEFSFNDNPHYSANKNFPETDISGFGHRRSISLHPRYQFYRMQQEYMHFLNLQTLYSTLSGSCTLIAPMTVFPVRWNSVEMVDNMKDAQKPDVWGSGLWVVTHWRLAVWGNNMQTTLSGVRNLFSKGDPGYDPESETSGPEMQPKEEPEKKEEEKIAEKELSAHALWGFDKYTYADMLPQGKAEIAEFSKWVNSNPKVTRLEVHGHTDPEGSDSYNQSLSERRANTVKEALVAGGVQKPIVAKGFGEKRLKVEGCAAKPTKAERDDCNLPNRRVEIQVFGDK